MKSSLGTRRKSSKAALLNTICCQRSLLVLWKFSLYQKLTVVCSCSSNILRKKSHTLFLLHVDKIVQLYTVKERRRKNAFFGKKSYSIPICWVKWKSRCLLNWMAMQGMLTWNMEVVARRKEKTRHFCPNVVKKEGRTRTDSVQRPRAKRDNGWD